MNRTDLNTYNLYANDPAAFRSILRIEAGSEVVSFEDFMDDWQRADFAAVDPGWLRCVGRTKTPDAKMRVYLERGRGHSKTFDIAVMICHALIFAPRMVRGFAFAADKDQSKLLRDAILKLIRINDWMNNRLAVQNYRVVVIDETLSSYESELQISSSDVGSSFGILPDFVVCDEIVHWSDSADALWHSVSSSAAKKPDCLLLVISNAGLGMGQSWQWLVRENAFNSEAWHFSRLDGPVASWISPQILNEQAESLPPSVYQRLWLNQWQKEGSGDAINAKLIQEAIVLPGPMEHPMAEYFYVAGVDLGVRKNHSAITVLAVDPIGPHFMLVHHINWNPQDTGGEISLRDVRQHLITLYHQYHLVSCRSDPFAARLLAQDLRTAGLAYNYHNSTLSESTEMCQKLLTVFQEGMIELYNCERLIRDLHRLRIVEKGNAKLKLEADVTKDGSHADLGMSLANAIWEASIQVGCLRRNQFQHNLENYDHVYEIACI